MLKVRRSPLKIPGRREKRAEALISQWSATYAVCFYPDDLTMYLIGTEEGFIHKCTTTYTEQFVGTYVSHTGPVYAIRFSPFAKDIFMSCGGDWCVKIWKEDFPAAPLLSLCTGMRTVFDVSWAPNMSSVFVCTNELDMEIWDISVNTLEPIIQFKFPNLGLRRCCFYEYMRGLLIGDDDGGVTLYALRNFPEQPRTIDGQIDHLLVGIIPGYKPRIVVDESEKSDETTTVSFEDEEEEEEDEDEEEEAEEEEEEETSTEIGETKKSKKGKKSKGKKSKDKKSKAKKSKGKQSGDEESKSEKSEKSGKSSESEKSKGKKSKSKKSKKGKKA